MSEPPTIIIAEPDPLFSNTLRIEFSSADFVALMAASAAEAEDFASRTNAHLVVLDARLPGVSAYDACARIRHLDGYQATPILLTVGAVTPKIMAAAAKASVTAVLAKPYSFNELLDKVTPHVAADSVLQTFRQSRPGMADAPNMVWGPPPSLRWPHGPGSELSRNSQMLGIVRRSGPPTGPTRKS
jgi:DNA-binding response OmpR family regulator